MLIKAPYPNTVILINYDKKDIYNCDETALFWLMEPNRTLSHGPVQGRKKRRSSFIIIDNKLRRQAAKFIHS